jgi:hypothetical protein
VRDRIGGSWVWNGEREREERVPTGVEEVEEGEDDAAGDGRV